MIRLCSLLLVSFVLHSGHLKAAPESVRAWMGVAIDQGKKGVAVTGVLKGTPAEQAGIAAGDEILAIDDTPVTAPKALIELIAAKGVGVKVKIRYLRGDKVQDLTLQLEAKPDMDQVQKKSLMGRPAPKFDLPVVFGSKGRLDQYQGKVVLLMFWATWCPACKAALPTVLAIPQTYHDKIKVVTIMNEEEKVIRDFFAGQPAPSFEVLRDPDGKVNGDYLVPALPSFIVIDRKGDIRHVTIGGGMYLDAALQVAESLTRP